MRRAALLLSTLLLLLAALPARAQTSVDVEYGQGGPRTLYVEDLLGQPLESLDFDGATTLPFRVRVVDDMFDHVGFTVDATMTNLYLDEGGDLDFGTQIDSNDLAIQNPLNPLNVLDVEALVQPVLTTLDITSLAVCTLLGFAATTCSIPAGDLEAKVQELTRAVDLSTLADLPLVPQAPEEGRFTHPDWVAADEPDGAEPATTRQLLGATPLSTNAFITLLDAQLDAALAAAPLDDIVNTSAVVDLVQDLAGPLSELQITDLLADATLSIAPLTSNELLYQTGTYISYPRLHIDLADEKPNGTYKGTLVVTGIQS